jgi:RTX calcium-binding nonapeptide repeat (4 copies)
VFSELQPDRAWTAVPDAVYGITGSTRNVTVFVQSGNVDRSFRFAAAPPDVLKPGVYDRAIRFEERGRPGIDVDSCNNNDARFEIKDFAVGADGVPTRLWAVFEYQCEETGWPQFGEIRYGVPGPDGSAYAVPAVQRWPAWDFGRPRVDAPVTVRAAAPAQLGAARITGTDAASFSIVSDGCSGQSLPAGASCQVLVRFGAAAPGARTATLEIGPAQSVLQGFNYGGRTRLDISGQPGDNGVEPPVFGAFTPPDSWFYVTGRDSAAGFYVAGRGSGWTGSFRAANGVPLALGRYTGAQNNMSQPSPQPAPGMSITNAWGYGDPCSSELREFTITDVTRYPDGATKSLGADFERRCTSPPGTIVAGTIAFRVGDTTPLAPWITGVPAGEPTPASSAPAPASRAKEVWRCTGPVRVRGTRRANRLRGTPRADRIVAGRGNDRINAGRGNDCVSGGPGRDRIAGGPGADLLLGGSGRDVLTGGPGKDRLDCGPGRDTVYVGRGDRTRHCERVRRR